MKRTTHSTLAQPVLKSAGTKLSQQSKRQQFYESNPGTHCAKMNSWFNATVSSNRIHFENKGTTIA